MSKNNGTNTKNQTVDQPGNSPSEALARMDGLIERRAAINKRIAEIKGEYGSVFANRHRFQTAIRDLMNRLGGMPENEKRFVQTRQELTAELERVRADTALNEEHFQLLEAEILQLETVELPACMVTVCAEDVMAHHQQITQARSVVDGIQAAIEAQNQLIEKIKTAIPSAADRQQERYNLLADIAMGNADEKELKELDAVIAKEQKTVSDAEKKHEPMIENAKATVSGLQHKLTAAKAAHQALESKSSEVAQRYFMGEAEKAAVQYVNDALSLKIQHRRLLGLDLILKKHGGREIVYSGAKPIQIPLFRLPQFEGLAKPGTYDGALLNGEEIYYGNQITQAADAEEAQFNAIIAGHRVP